MQVPVEELSLIHIWATDLQSRIYADEETAARAAGALEQTLAALARRAFEAGYTRIIAAGGETSGAVALALGFDGFIIGESIAPGVPVMVPLNHQNIRIALKSGNFGQPDFFLRALEQTANESVSYTHLDVYKRQVLKLYI